MSGMAEGCRVGKTKDGYESRNSHLLYNSVFDAKRGGINLFIAICRLKIKPAFGLFDGFSFDCMRINHGGSDITVTQQFLNCADIIVGLQQVAGKTVPESMGGCAFRDFSLPY